MAGTRVGHARCSTDQQGVIVQTEQLHALGVALDRIYIDRGFSGTTRTNRAGLDQALAGVWDGNIFTVTKFDRFARNMTEATQILTCAPAAYCSASVPRSTTGTPRSGACSCKSWRWSRNSRPTSTTCEPAKHGHRQTQGQTARQTAQAPRVSATFHPPPLRRRRSVPS